MHTRGISVHKGRVAIPYSIQLQLMSVGYFLGDAVACEMHGHDGDLHIDNFFSSNALTCDFGYTL